MITLNQTAPDFVATDITGTSVRLSDFRGKKILLSFLRNGACALCNLRIHALIGRYEYYKERGLEIVAVFESPIEDMVDEVGRQSAPFPILSDPDGAVHDLFGVENSMEKVEATMRAAEIEQTILSAAAIGFALKPQEKANFARIPADFLLDENLAVRILHYGDVVFDHLPLEAIDRFAANNVERERVVA